MAPKKRSQTPGPKAAAKQSTPSGRDQKAPSSSPTSQSGESVKSSRITGPPPAPPTATYVAPPPPAAPRSEPVVEQAPPAAPAEEEAPHGLRRSKVAPRRHTDCGCLLVLVVFIGYLVALRLRSSEHGDLRRLTNGFDFRGRLCGQHDPEHAFLHWCSHEGRTLWEAPICVRRCPVGGERVMCPVFTEEDAESRETLTNGSVVLTQVTRHVLTPLSAGKTRRHWRFCAPEGLGSEGLERLVVGGDSWQEYFFQEAAHVSALVNAPHLVTACVACAVLTALMWVFLLSKFTEALLRVQFLFCGLALTGAGLLLSARALAVTNGAGGGGLAALGGVAPKIQGAAQGMGSFVSMGLEAVQMQGLLRFQLGFLGPTAQACVGMGLAAIGLGVLIWYALSRKTIAVAADCSREACKVALRSPSLALLPLLEVLLRAAVLLETGYSAALLLSTADVKPRDVVLLSQRVVGIHRSIQWDVALVLHTLSWIFAFLWLSEIVTALRSFILSKVAATWYFEPTSRRRCFNLPILDGTITALVYHLGSLALGGFMMAWLRAVQWFFLLLHKLVGEGKEQNRCLRFCLGCFEFLITLAQQLARHLTANAYTDLAITSTSLATSSASAAKLLVDGAGLTAIRSMFLRPVIFIGNVAYSVAFAWGVWALAGHLDNADSPLTLRLPQAFAAEKAVLGGAGPLAVLAGGVALVTVHAFASVVEDIADAVLYCYLWDRSDGTVDAEGVPASFKALLGKMAVP